MIVVTGASGLLGSAMVWTLRKRGREAAGICHQHFFDLPDVPMFSVDLRDHAAMRELLMRLRPAGIVHCAAATNVDWCERNPAEAEKVNAHGSAALADAAAHLEARFLYISTDAVFDGKVGNYSESDKPCPVNAYGQSKLHGEEAVLTRCPSSLVVRVTIYGWNGQPKQSLAEWVLGKLEAGERVQAFTDVRFAPLLVNDLADILLALLDGKWAGVYHAGSSDGLSKYEFAQMIASVFDFDPEHVLPSRLEDARLLARRPLNTTLNSKKLELALGCEMPGVIQGIGKFRELRENGYAEKVKIHSNRSRT